MKVYQYEDSVGTKAKQLMFEVDEVNTLTIVGTHPVEDLYVSFDGGTTWWTEGDVFLYSFGKEKIKLDHKVWVKGTGAGTTFEVLITA